jgi:hypothetical protein
MVKDLGPAGSFKGSPAIGDKFFIIAADETLR